MYLVKLKNEISSSFGGTQVVHIIGLITLWGVTTMTISNEVTALPSTGVGKLFSRGAAGQGLLSRTAACYKRNCISSIFCDMSLQCGIPERNNGGVSKKKKKVIAFSKTVNA